MKGLTHFISGVAFATFFPEAVDRAISNTSFIMTIGGIFGILPDTIDFKWARFVEPYHVEIDPHPDDIKPQEIAEKIMKLAEEVDRTGKDRSIKINTVKLGADLWRQYSIKFLPEEKEVVVEVGPIVTTSRAPYLGTEPEEMEKRIGRAKGGVRIFQHYEEETIVDIFSGPSFTFTKKGDGVVEAIFIPWHRRYSHSITLGILIGLIMWALLGFIYGIVAGGAFILHILEDQIGYLGNNLFYPFTRRRLPGFRLMNSSDALPNFGTVWLSIVFIFYNLNRFARTPSFEAPFIPYFLITYIIPIGLIYLYSRFVPSSRETVRRGSKKIDPSIIKARERSSEIEDPFS